MQTSPTIIHWNWLNYGQFLNYQVQIKQILLTDAVLWSNVRSVKIFFAKDFLQLNFISLMVFFTWHCSIIILSFPEKISCHICTAILPPQPPPNPQSQSLIIKFKLNVYKTYVSSIYVLFNVECSRFLKLILLNKP